VLEGYAGMKYRIASWEMGAGVEAGTTEFLNARFLSLADLRELQKVEKFDVVIVDTASKSGLIENESSNPDVATFLDAFEKAVHEGNPAAVALVVHHVTETTDNHGRKHSKARGASAWRDNSDVLILIEGRKANFSLTTDEPYGKQRDGDSVTIKGLSLQRLGPAYVITEQAKPEETDREEETVARTDWKAEQDAAELRKAFKGRTMTDKAAREHLGHKEGGSMVSAERVRRAKNLLNL
jgi:hypothetical protein